MNANINMNGTGCSRIVPYFRSIRAIVAIWTFFLLAAGCDKIPPGIGSEENLSGESALVRLTVGLSRPVLPDDAGTRSGDAENSISEVAVLVFEQVGGDYIYRYMAEGERISSSGNTVQFDVLLSGTLNPVKLMLVCNYGDAFGNYVPASGTGEAVVRKTLGISYAGITGNLPMYGEAVLPSGLQAGSENVLHVKVLRGVARADIIKELDADSRPFRIGQVYVYRPNDKIQAIPNRLAVQDPPRVAEPSVFSGAKPLSVPVSIQPAGSDPVSVTGIYVPEAAGSSDPAQQQTGAVCIVVGGYYNGSGQLSYYRIDFDPGVDGHPFGQVLRNHKYVFRIKKVTGAGWNNPDAAATGKSTGIVAQVEAWEDFTTEMYFEGNNYLGISSRTLKLGYSAGKSKRIDVQATLPYTVQWLDGSGSPAGTAVSGIGAVSTAGNFSVEIVKDTGDGEAVSHLSFRTVNANRTDAEIKSVLRVTGGRWTFDITVTQESPQKNKNRIIRVLSVSELGDLGTSSPSTAGGLPLRRILDNTKNFSPTGTVIVGGFSFTRVSRGEMQVTNTGSDKEVFRGVQSTIWAQDVIYLSYNTPISTELARVVLAWLQEDPRRVLIVGTDTNSSSQNLRQFLTEDGTWKYYNLDNIGGAFKRAVQTDANKRFFSMPFGTVAVDAPISRADSFAGYCSGYPVWVTPLVVSNVPGKEQNFIIGVNLRDRIVYHGDANLNQSDRLSSQANTDGTVTTDFDRLMANLWAWIAETVCGDA